MITPANLSIFTASGGTDMTARFSLAKRFVLAWARCHFIRTAGSGTETATLTINLDSGKGSDFDTKLWSLTAGNGADMNFRVPVEEHNDWTFDAGDQVYFAWTNPDAGEITWGLTVALGEAY